MKALLSPDRYLSVRVVRSVRSVAFPSPWTGRRRGAQGSSSRRCLEMPRGAVRMVSWKNIRFEHDSAFAPHLASDVRMQTDEAVVEKSVTKLSL